MFVIHALGYGGAGKMIVYLANHFSKIGYDVVIYVEEQMGKHYDMEPGVRIYQETEFFKNYYTRHFRQIFQLRRRVKEINPDLLIGISHFRADIVCAIDCKAKKIIESHVPRSFIENTNNKYINIIYKQIRPNFLFIFII